MPSAEIHWRCDSIDFEADDKPQEVVDFILNLITKYIIRRYKPKRLNIRASPTGVIHKTTNGTSKAYRPGVHPKGTHITGEYQDPRDDKWIGFRIYVTKTRVKGRKVWVKNDGVDPNPEIFSDRPATYERAPPLMSFNRRDTVRY